MNTFVYLANTIQKIGKYGWFRTRVDSFSFKNNGD